MDIYTLYGLIEYNSCYELTSFAEPFLEFQDAKNVALKKINTIVDEYKIGKDEMYVVEDGESYSLFLQRPESIRVEIYIYKKELQIKEQSTVQKQQSYITA